MDAKRKRDAQIRTVRRVVVPVNPDTRAYLDRFENTDTSREAILRLQRIRINPSKELLKAQSKRKRKQRKGGAKRNLRGEVAEIKRKAKITKDRRVYDAAGNVVREEGIGGLRRYADEQEPRLFGGPAPIDWRTLFAGIGGDGGGVFNFDPEIQRQRLAIKDRESRESYLLAEAQLRLDAEQINLNRERLDADDAQENRRLDQEQQRIDDARDVAEEDLRRIGAESEADITLAERRQALAEQEQRQRAEDLAAERERLQVIRQGGEGQLVAQDPRVAELTGRLAAQEEGAERDRARAFADARDANTAAQAQNDEIRRLAQELGQAQEAAARGPRATRSTEEAVGRLRADPEQDLRDRTQAGGGGDGGVGGAGRLPEGRGRVDTASSDTGGGGSGSGGSGSGGSGSGPPFSGSEPEDLFERRATEAEQRQQQEAAETAQQSQDAAGLRDELGLPDDATDEEVVTRVRTTGTGRPRRRRREEGEDEEPPPPPTEPLPLPPREPNVPPPRTTPPEPEPEPEPVQDDPGEYTEEDEPVDVGTQYEPPEGDYQLSEDEDEPGTGPFERLGRDEALRRARQVRQPIGTQTEPDEPVETGEIGTDPFEPTETETTEIGTDPIEPAETTQIETGTGPDTPVTTTDTGTDPIDFPSPRSRRSPRSRDRSRDRDRDRSRDRSRRRSPSPSPRGRRSPIPREEPEPPKPEQPKPERPKPQKPRGPTELEKLEREYLELDAERVRLVGLQGGGTKFAQRGVPPQAGEERNIRDVEEELDQVKSLVKQARARAGRGQETFGVSISLGGGRREDIEGAPLGPVQRTDLTQSGRLPVGELEWSRGGGVDLEQMSPEQRQEQAADILRREVAEGRIDPAARRESLAVFDAMDEDIEQVRAGYIAPSGWVLENPNDGPFHDVNPGGRVNIIGRKGDVYRINTGKGAFATTSMARSAVVRAITKGDLRLVKGQARERPAHLYRDFQNR